MSNEPKAAESGQDQTPRGKPSPIKPLLVMLVPLALLILLYYVTKR